MDITETFRRGEVNRINSEVESQDENAERARLEAIHGKDNVWNTDEATQTFSFLSFGAPYVSVRRKSDNVKGSLEFQHAPRFYFNFVAS